MKLLKIFNLCNIYTILWIVYYLQGTLYESGSFLSQTILTIILFIGIFVFIKVMIFEKNKPTFFFALNIFLLLIGVYGIYGILFQGPLRFGTSSMMTVPTNYVKNVIISLFPIYVFFYFSKKKYVTLNWLRSIIFILILLTINQYYFAEQELIKEFIEQGEFTNNAGYLFLGLIPLLTFWKKNKFIQYGLMVLIFYFIISSFKRGAILIGFVCLLYFFYNTYRSSSKKERKILLFVTALAIIVGIYYVMYLIDSSAYFNERVKLTLNGYTSHRDIIYEKLINFYLYDVNVVRFVFGCGPDYTVVVAGDFAHQDWLELLIDTGILGLFVYIGFFWSLYKNIKELRTEPICYQAGMLSLFILLMKSMFSMSYAEASIGISMSLGFALAQLKKNDVNK